MEARPIDGLFDDDRVIVLTSPIDPADLDTLADAEAALVARAVEKRRREFATGRALAREALARLGVRGFALLNGDDRAPIWPEGIAGSISHCDTRAFVAVGRRAEVGTLGVDVEHRAGLKRELWRMTLRDEEIAWLDRAGDEAQLELALAIFSAKEALYKAQYPVSSTYMGFMELSVDLDARARTLRCTFQNDVLPFRAGEVVTGRFRKVEGELVSAVHIPPR